MENGRTSSIGIISSKDGARIGYRQLGRGVGLVLVHGGRFIVHKCQKKGNMRSSGWKHSNQH